MNAMCALSIILSPRSLKLRLCLTNDLVDETYHNEAIYVNVSFSCVVNVIQGVAYQQSHPETLVVVFCIVYECLNGCDAIQPGESNQLTGQNSR